MVVLGKKGLRGTFLKLKFHKQLLSLIVMEFWSCHFNFGGGDAYKALC